MGLWSFHPETPRDCWRDLEVLQSASSSAFSSTVSGQRESTEDTLCPQVFSWRSQLKRILPMEWCVARIPSTERVPGVWGDGDTPQRIVFIWVFSSGQVTVPQTQVLQSQLCPPGSTGTMRGKVLFSPTVFKSRQWRPSHTPLVFLSQRSHYWQDSPFSLTSTGSELAVLPCAA